METVLIKITGMRCQRCVDSVRAALSTLSGVEPIEILLDRGEARVRFDPRSTTTDQLRTAIENAGFDVT